MADEWFDVVVVGAGLSGIGMARHLKVECPDLSFTVLEARARLGGTWDLFRYPGVRSDSDMYTLGYSFRPWTEEKAIAEGGSILSYLQDTARESGVEPHIRTRTRVVAADWSSADAAWTLTVDVAGERRTVACRFVVMCTGYYDYARGHAPAFAGADDFAGQIVHPQFWPENLDVSGKRVAVIGSGATAVTLVPALADRGAQVAMVQRSPSYVVARPASDRIANGLRRLIGARRATDAIRWRNALIGQFFYSRMRKHPKAAAEKLIGWVRDHLGPDYDVATHFTPRYDPWDQRLCLVPDGDLFEAIKAGRAEVVTGTIDRFEAEGIVMEDGTRVPADIIVTATGLELKLMDDMPVRIDGRPVDFARTLNYKGMMFSDVPNLAYTFGYTNASWTLKADLTAAYVCRLLNAMRARGMRSATPRVGEGEAGDEAFLDFTSTYVQRAIDRFPKQGKRAPWRLHQNYLKDLMALRFGRVDDAIEFAHPERGEQRAA
ncbi:FAD-containing monooxygenase EthA [Sphingomonas spermidinifaciens]|uniref:FAD-containing monooxygenase EthA n=1 Tax=Sphingomonas spermidinifaciens TaxID=1141889 RepID=A0A2A4B6N7_9SPHN|nr:NAD(P)/FAD-dependent oxidoreductase [Sphingomonas spermidinifaciens]PCD03449.1 FAD-containing monooxygenase EthA [Sphingomonas spermidinifaciens]